MIQVNKYLIFVQIKEGNKIDYLITEKTLTNQYYKHKNYNLIGLKHLIFVTVLTDCL